MKTNRTVISLPLLASVPPSTAEKVFVEGKVSIRKINIPGKQFQAKLLGSLCSESQLLGLLWP